MVGIENSLKSQFNFIYQLIDELKHQGKGKNNKSLYDELKRALTALEVHYTIGKFYKNKKVSLSEPIQDEDVSINSVEELIERAERFRSIYENSYIGIYRTTPGGEIILANPALCKMLGYSSFEELAVRDLNKQGFEPSYERKQFIEQIDLYGEIRGLESAWIRKDGTTLFIRESARAIRNSGGQTLYYDGTVEDITERKQAEISLRESEERLRLIIENSEDMVFIQDLNGNYIYYKGSPIYDIKQENIIGKNYKEIHNPKYASLFWERLNKVIKTGKGIIEETEFEWKGKKYWFLDNIYPIKGKDKKIISIATISRNITKLKKTYFDLKKNEELFKEIFKSIPGLATLWKKDQGNKIILIMANESAIIETKSKINDFIGIEVKEFFTNSPEVARQIIDTMITGEKNRLEIRTKLRTTGEMKFLIVACVKINKNMVLNFAQDITEREHAREELQRYEEELYKLTQHIETIREEERAEIARTIHDDLGQSLTALKMDLSGIRMEIKKQDKSILEKIEIMSSIIDSTIKTVQRISSELRPGILDDLGLPAAIEWLTDEIHRRANINFKIHIQPENIILEEKVSVTIFRIVQEILTNVIRHSGAKNVSIRLRVDDGEAYIDVKDNGIGIPDEKINDSNSLGLIGIRERVRAWNGTFEIKGEKNIGTEVTIKLKLK